MAGTKARKPSVAVVNRWIKAGFGQGSGPKFKPFMFVRDVPSMGTSSMVQSRKTGRNHHYLSDQEFKVHLLAEYSQHTLDIREQFALLPWEETQAIALQLGLRHPIFPGTTTPTVLTTDLLLDLKRPDGTELVAISVKLTKDLTPRNLEKLLLEKVYWGLRGIRWILATEKNIPKLRTSNLKFFETSLQDDRAAKAAIDPAEFSRRFEEHWMEESSFNEIMHKTIESTDVDIHTGHALLGTAVWNHRSRIDIDAARLTHRNRVVLAR
jgi:hypothetical protein